MDESTGRDSPKRSAVVKQDDVAGKILMELCELGIATKDNEWILYNYLAQAYAAGWDYCRYDLRAKKQPVTQKTKDGKVVKVHASILSASREVDVNVATIGRALRGKLKTAAGYTWEYTNKKKPTSSKTETQTVGSSKPVSAPPK